MKKAGKNVFLFVCALVGVALVVLSVLDILQDSIWMGFGAGLAVVGLIQLGRAFAAEKNPEYREKRETEEKDERNRFVMMKAWSWTGTAYIVLCGILLIVMMIIGNEEFANFASLSACAMLVIYFVSHAIANKRY